MKKVKRITAITLALVLTLGIFAIAPITADAATPAWKTAYINFVNKKEREAQSSPTFDNAQFWLYDFDGNGVPELLFNQGYRLGEHTFLTFANNNLVQLNLGTADGYYRYGNKLYTLGGKQGYYGENVINVNGGSLTYVFSGLYTAISYDFDFDNPYDFTYEYRDNNYSDYQYVSYSEYSSKLNKVFNKKAAVCISSQKGYSFSGVKTAINNYQPKLAAPALSVSNKSNGIRAEWKKVSSAAKYIVYYKKASDSSWKSTTTSNTYYALLNTIPGTKYSFQVQAVTSGGAKGNYSKVANLEFKLMATTVTLSNKSNGIRADWKKVPGAAKYIVYYKKASDSAWKSATTKNLYYPVLNTTAGTKYKVQVQAVASNGAKGYYSKVYSLTFN